MGSWYYATGQAWKIYVFLLLLMMSLSISGVSCVRDAGADSNWALSLAAIVSSATTVVWISLAIRCPFCKGRPVWRIIHTGEVSSWFTTVLSMDSCPICPGKGNIADTNRK
jgi:hypothetical protein